MLLTARWGELPRKALAELVGSALLAATVVGSGIAAQTLSPGEPGVQLLINSLVTGAVLVALVLALGPVSAAFNPVVTLAERLLGGLSTSVAVALVAAQLAGCCMGVVVANVMFELPPVHLSDTARGGTGVLVGEVVATFGLLLVVLGVARSGRTAHLAVAVGGYVSAAYWFTSSTSFANPALTVSRTLSDTFAGIGASSAPAFVVAQLLGAALAVGTAVVLHPDVRVAAERLVHADGLVPPNPAEELRP